MKIKCISQEMLKLIACVTMLLDHIGAVLLPWRWLRIIGRVSFPIYCFLLVEGVAHSRNLKKYGLRLLIGAALAEIPFDCLFFGEPTWAHQSVMVTLLIGYAMVILARKIGILMPFVLCYFAAKYANVDYRGFGIALIAVFYVAQVYGKQFKNLLQTGGVGVACWMKNSVRVAILGCSVPMQFFGVLSMIPISLYSGEKKTKSKWLQWGFYLFYPVHMVVLLIVNMIM